MYREISGTDERVRAIPGVRDRRVRATKVRLYTAVVAFPGQNNSDGIRVTCLLSALSRNVSM